MGRQGVCCTSSNGCGVAMLEAWPSLISPSSKLSFLWEDRKVRDLPRIVDDFPKALHLPPESCKGGPMQGIILQAGKSRIIPFLESLSSLRRHFILAVRLTPAPQSLWSVLLTGIVGSQGYTVESKPDYLPVANVRENVLACELIAVPYLHPYSRY